MGNLIIKRKNIFVKNLIVSVIVLTVTYFLPVISHILPIPLYLLDPMRFLILIGLLFFKGKSYNYFLAFTIPIFSSLVTGHPTIAKSLLISIELVANVYLLFYCIQKIKLPTFYIFFGSIVVSKLVYYFSKFAFIHTGLIYGKLITTNLFTQAITVIVMSLLFGYLYKNKVNSVDKKIDNEFL